MAATILVHGATGFTGRLVCAALARRGLEFAAGGRDPAKLAELACAHGCETVRIDLKDAETLVAAVANRKVVLACAGPFMALGEPMLATCARAGIAYADTTGEQRFVADMGRYRATAEARGACIASAMAYEIAPADWAAHEASEAIGGAPDRLSIAYLFQGASGGYASATTRGTKRSALHMLADDKPRQYVERALTLEPIGEHLLQVEDEAGRTFTTLSFPSPEALLVPRHTGARTVRTFMAMGQGASQVLHRARRVLPALGALAKSFGERFVDRTPRGPEAAAREATFEIVAIAEKSGRRAVTRVSGRDPYGLTAQIQALFAARVLEGKVTAKGIVAPSEVIAPSDAFDALAVTGLRRNTQ